MRPSVSVVIPVYNVEQYLPRCVESVFAQTLRDIEIILVDDGSPDGCGAMCDAYAKEDPRVKVVHKQNGGLASARNAGMDVMTGEYLFFLDSDDWIDPDGLERLLALAKEYDVDFVRFRAMRTGWPGHPEDMPAVLEDAREIPGGFYDRKRIVSDVFPKLFATNAITMGAITGACTSLYAVRFLNDNKLRFSDDVQFSEDIIFSARVVRAAQSFYYLEEGGIYRYWYNPASISKSFRAGRWDACKKLIEHCEREFAADPDYDFTDELLCLRWFCIFLALNERRFIEDKKARVAYCDGIVRDPVTVATPLRASAFDVSKKQLALMRLVKAKAGRLIAMI